MITKEKLLTGLVGMFIGMICSKVIIYFLAANGGGDIWLVSHRFYTTLIISMVFALAAVIFSSIKKQK